MTRKLFRLGPGALVVVTLVTGMVARQGTPQTAEWRRGGGSDGRNNRYSPLDQINPNNVRTLKTAWIWRADNVGSAPEYKNETTPIYVGGALYFTAGDRRSVIAADPATGETLWMWRIDEGARAAGVRKNSRGVAYWSDGGESRILMVT